MMRVVFLCDAKYEGGAERYLLRLAGGLDGGVFEPFIVLPDRPELDHLAQTVRAAGIELVRSGTGAFAGISGRLAVQSALKSLAPTLVHLNLPSTYDLGCGTAALQARAAGARGVVSTEHIVDLRPSRRRAMLKRFSMGSIDRVIAISKKHREILESRHGVPGSKIRVILNGVEDPGKPAQRHNSIPRIVCVGSLESRKGQDILIDAIAAMDRAGIDAELVLVGDGLDRGTLEAAVRSGGSRLSSRVTFTGRLDSAWSEFCRADIVAVPSRQEGIPFSTMEAMAAGAALIASAVPGVDEVIDDGRTGILVTPGDARAWAERLAELVTDRERQIRLGAAARDEYERRFTLERMARDTESVYREVLAGC